MRGMLAAAVGPLALAALLGAGACAGPQAAELGRLRAEVRARPGEFAPRYRLGAALLRLARPEEARQAFAAALACPAPPAGEDPAATPARAWYGLGAALDALGRPQAAAAALRRGLRLEPGYAGCARRLGLVYRELGRPRRALARLEAVARQEGAGPAGWAAAAEAAEIQEQLGRPREALVLLERAAGAEAPAAERAAARAAAGRILAALGEDGAARRAFQQALAEVPRHPAANRGLAALLERAGDFSGAAAAWRLALTAEPDDRESRRRLENLAAALAGRERRGEALGESERLALAQVREWRGDFAGAAAAYRRLLEERPGCAEAAFRLGVLLAAGLGDAAGARRAFQACLAAPGADPALAAAARRWLARLARAREDAGAAPPAPAEHSAVEERG